MANPPDTLNRFLLGNRNGKITPVLLLRRTTEGIAPLELGSEEAINLAAWLIVMTEMTCGVADAGARVAELAEEIRRT